MPSTAGDRAHVIERLGRAGIWTRQLDARPPLEAEAAVAELERLGYRAVWIPEAVHREVISHASLLLAATTSIVVATGIARIHARAPQATALAQRLLAARFPGRFLLGLGVSHPLIVEGVLGQTFGPPVTTMRRYLDAMDSTRGGEPAPAGTTPRVLAALGPKMVHLAAECSAGVHTYMAPAAHTAWARQALGPGPLLAPAVKAVLTSDLAEGAVVARASLKPTLRSPAYRKNCLRFGFDEDDLAGDLSDRLVDALVVVGDEDAVAARVHEHLDAGADHVCVELLTGDDTTVPIDAWRRLAPRLTGSV
jgi:probable F420-dependent oxidoreductase